MITTSTVVSSAAVSEAPMDKKTLESANKLLVKCYLEGTPTAPGVVCVSLQSRGIRYCIRVLVYYYDDDDDYYYYKSILFPVMMILALNRRSHQ